MYFVCVFFLKIMQRVKGQGETKTPKQGVWPGCHTRTRHGRATDLPPGTISTSLRIHIKANSRQISFVNNTHYSDSFVMKFCTEHGSITAVLRAKFKKILGDWEINPGQTRFHDIWFTANRLQYRISISETRTKSKSHQNFFVYY